jgi:hypothetical protein
MTIEHVTRHAVKAVERQQQCIDLISKVSLYELEQGRTDPLGDASESRQLIREAIPALVRAVSDYAACIKLALSGADDSDFFPAWHNAEKARELAIEGVKAFTHAAYYLTDEQLEALGIDDFE